MYGWKFYFIVVCMDQINCARSVAAFIREVRSNLKKYCRTDTVAVISTNEDNESILETLRAQDDFIVLSSKFLQGAVRHKMKMNPLNEFVLSLLLMCDAKYFFAWGKSSVHDFIQDCRDHVANKQIYLTYINSVIFRRKKATGWLAYVCMYRLFVLIL